MRKYLMLVATFLWVEVLLWFTTHYYDYSVWVTTSLWFISFAVGIALFCYWISKFADAIYPNKDNK